MPTLQSQDAVILLKLSLQAKTRPLGATSEAHKANWTYLSLAKSLLMSTQTVHAGLKTATVAKLFDPGTRYPIAGNLLEFLVHGIKYCFPVRPGETTRGIPTSSWASPLESKFPQSQEPPLVWPFPEGQVVGRAFEPLHRAVPIAALRDEALRELLVLVDAIREGRPRVVAIATDELKARLLP